MSAPPTETTAIPAAPPPSVGIAPTTAGRFTKLTKAVRRNVAIRGLPTDKLNLARDMAKEGCRNHTIRTALGLDVKTFNALLKPIEDAETGEQLPSALRTALDEGHALGADEILTVMRANARAGDQRACEFLADRVYKIGKEDGTSEVPRVAIFINAALTPEEYSKVISVAAPAA
jgi:hypothetical protein